MNVRCTCASVICQQSSFENPVVTIHLVHSAKMGRKIPARKHHGVRDPIKQNEVRLFKIKDKINNPPELQKDKQRVSYKMNQFMKLKEDSKTGKVKKHNRSVHHEDRPKSRPQKKYKPIAPLTNETGSQYMRRVNRITQEGIKEAEYESKYGVDVVRDSKTGKITIKKRPKDEITELMKSQRGNRKGKVPVKPIDPKVAKALIKQAIAETKKDEKVKEPQEEFKRDTFKFGEVVFAPPTLVTPRRAQKSETVPRPGKKDSLLLKKLLKEEAKESLEESPKPKAKNSVKKSKLSVDLKGKRKALPMATRNMIEEQQNKAVEMYRQMKKNKMKEI